MLCVTCHLSPVTYDFLIHLVFIFIHYYYFLLEKWCWSLDLALVAYSPADIVPLGPKDTRWEVLDITEYYSRQCGNTLKMSAI